LYDIIGDIHGHADELIELLDRLGYELCDGTFRHPARTAIFVGDFVDRGPQISEAVRLVRAMHAAGTALAIMGNHEFNALAYHTPDPAPAPAHAGRHLRQHSDKNTHQHAETLRQVPEDELRDHLEWFRQLPLWLQLDGLRIVHACWDHRQMAVIEACLLSHGSVTTAFLCEATDGGSPLFQAIEDVLKGKEIRLPDGNFYLDKDGHERRAMRIKWYRSPASETFASYAFSSDDGLSNEPLPDSVVESVVPYPADADPVFFGHYWMRAERPERLAANVACVDFSVAKGGCLCAYRWDGERELSNDKFCTVAAKDGDQ